MTKIDINPAGKKDGFDCGSCRGEPRRTPTGTNHTAALLGRPLLACKNPQPAMFNQQDVIYFDLVRTQLVHELSGYSHSDFWPRIVLCESMLDKCARESVLAIGALSAAIRLASQLRDQSSQPSVLHPWSVTIIANHHHKAAVCHYIKALSMFRGRMEAGTTAASPRSVFIMSMLFITFEMLQGNMETVDNLITSSIDILKNALKLYRHDVGLERDTQLTRRPAEDDMDDIEHLLPLLSIMSGYTPFLRSQSSNIQLWDPSNGTDLPYPGQSSIGKLHTQWSKFSTRAVAFIAGSMDFPMLTSSAQRAMEAQQQVLLTHLRIWEAELNSWLAGENAHGPKAIHTATLQVMQIQHLMILICVSSCLDPMNLAYDAHGSDFDTLLARCTIFLHESRPAYLFTLTTSILSALFVVATKCRVHNTRMMAAGLLRQLPWREGAWEPTLMLVGKLGGVLMEERGRDESGFIPPEHRWFWVGAEWDAERRFLLADYISGGNKAVMKTLVLDPERCPDVCSGIGCFVDHDAERENLLSGNAWWGKNNTGVGISMPSMRARPPRGTSP